jgi:hypothetical protein
MKNLFIAILFLLMRTLGQAQENEQPKTAPAEPPKKESLGEVYFRIGKNFTRYGFKSADGASKNDFNTGAGDFYEVGYTTRIRANIFYNVGVVLHGYNSSVASNANSYIWDTEYIGIRNSLQYNFLGTEFVNFYITTGLDITTMLQGQQAINGAIFDLKGEKEFSGIVVAPLIGMAAKSPIADLGYMSVGLNYSKSFNVSNSTTEKLSFITTQIYFGLHFNINKKKKDEKGTIAIAPIN